MIALGVIQVTTENVFSFRVTGTTPSGIPVSDLADMLDSFEKALKVLVQASDSVEPTISLVGVRSRSAIFEFASDMPKQVGDAVSVIATGVKSRSIGGLPKEARAAVQKVVPFLKRRGTEEAVFEIRVGPDTESPPIVSISTKDEFPYQTPRVQGHTILYGILTWIGGERPRAHIRLDNGDLLNCRISRPLARKLAPRLYEEVGVEGLATWDTEDWSILEFEVTGVTDYKEGRILDAFDDLSDALGDSWSDVDDVNEEIRRLRGENEA